MIAFALVSSQAHAENVVSCYYNTVKGTPVVVLYGLHQSGNWKKEETLKFSSYAQRDLAFDICLKAVNFYEIKKCKPTHSVSEPENNFCGVNLRTGGYRENRILTTTYDDALDYIIDALAKDLQE